jgi:hypothetical protein
VVPVWVTGAVGVVGMGVGLLACSRWGVERVVLGLSNVDGWCFEKVRRWGGEVERWCGVVLGRLVGRRVGVVGRRIDEKQLWWLPVNYSYQ